MPPPNTESACFHSAALQGQYEQVISTIAVHGPHPAITGSSRTRLRFLETGHTERHGCDDDSFNAFSPFERGQQNSKEKIVMKLRMVLSALTLAMSVYAAQAFAQLAVPISHFLVPASPTSADNLTLSMNRPCSDTEPYIANAYTVSMSQNNITVRRGDVANGIHGVCPASTRDEIDLGRLPAGNYTLTVINAAVGSFPSEVAVSNFPFTVKDARALKSAPYVRLDYSGHWWDPNDSGWGLFIWHDARDNVLAAWFTYGTDGKPIWNVFQPTWQTFAATSSAPISQTSRMPGPTSPPPNPTTYTTVGSASLDFTSKPVVNELTPYNAGKLTYTFNDGQTIVRNIRRFQQ